MNSGIGSIFVGWYESHLKTFFSEIGRQSITKEYIKHYKHAKQGFTVIRHSMFRAIFEEFLANL